MKVWFMYRYSMRISRERKRGVCTGTVCESVGNESVVHVPVQHANQSGDWMCVYSTAIRSRDDDVVVTKHQLLE